MKRTNIVRKLKMAYDWKQQCSQDFLIWGWVGVWGQMPSRRRQGGLRTEPPALGNFYNFSMKITHFYACFSQNSYFKAITYQFKAFKLV